LEPAIPEMEQVMRWIGFDEQKAKRVATQIGEVLPLGCEDVD
jgi:hypothetical protein